MPDQTSALSLPLILPSQAQKHVTHNEALRILDVAVQLSVQSRSQTDPPPNPAEGARFIVKSPATGAWQGHATEVATFTPEGWEFHEPKTGWRAFVEDESQIAVFDGLAWVVLGGELLSTDMIGVNTTADPVNRLSVKGDAALFNAEGNGIRVKINKNGANQVASLLFQMGFSGRAELGLIGDNDLSVKVSADGTTFTDALQVARDTGRVRVPVGLRAQSGTAAAPSLSFIDDPNTGLFAPSPDEIGFSTDGVARAVLTNAGLDAVNLTQGGSQVFGRNNLLGPVAFQGGLPSGAVIETGENANGRFVKFADGTAFCLHRLTGISTTAQIGASGIYFNNPNFSWNFPITLQWNKPRLLWGNVSNTAPGISVNLAWDNGTGMVGGRVYTNGALGSVDVTVGVFGFWN
ncbi:DUF2793 domain-containing protein [Aliigemmobacter aestuarii]|uniref:DUF2793 domain-containing protein n=1 Tax=Aliigemmobacter aestuarii TaxID=1445661 RepID=A0A4V3V0R6_9RHOB|nr:DUF2793 domain-containing protein [Gemmobacter aestuarii]THD85002.1 DUF2793 domain-containing protein [Gemmobacter aestuarii]